MARDRQLSGPAMEIAGIVFRLGKARVRDVVAALPVERPMDFSTVQTYLRRLKTKGVLATTQEGRTDVYSAAVRPKSVVRDVVGDLVDRLFGGDTLPLVEHLIADHKLSDEQIDQLQATLNRLKSKRKGKR
jgi:BlaI family penicillinase repressor